MAPVTGIFIGLAVVVFLIISAGAVFLSWNPLRWVHLRFSGRSAHGQAEGGFEASFDGGDGGGD
jgi:hypothetical protein